MASIGDQLAESTHEFKSIPTDNNISQNLHLIGSSHLPALPKQSTPPDHSNDILGIYLSEIGRISDLSYQDELNLFTKINKLETHIEEYRMLVKELDTQNDKSLAINTWSKTIDLQQQIHIIASRISVAKDRIIEGNLKKDIKVAV